MNCWKYHDCDYCLCLVISCPIHSNAVLHAKLNYFILYIGQTNGMQIGKTYLAIVYQDGLCNFQLISW